MKMEESSFCERDTSKIYAENHINKGFAKRKSPFYVIEMNNIFYVCKGLNILNSHKDKRTANRNKAYLERTTLW